MASHISEIIFLISTLLAAIGLSFIIYSRDKQNRSSKLFLLTLLLVIGYIFSHGFHFLVMESGDVTILDRSCHSFLLLIAATLTFFAWNYPYEKKLNKIVLSIILIPTLIILVLLWTGFFVMKSHAHEVHFEPHFTSFYPVFLAWYIILVGVISQGNYWVFILEGVYTCIIALAIHLYLIIISKPFIKNEITRIIISIIILGLCNSLIVVVLNLYTLQSIFSHFPNMLDAMFLNMKIGAMLGLFMGVGIELANYFVEVVFKEKKVAS